MKYRHNLGAASVAINSRTKFIQTRAGIGFAAAQHLVNTGQYHLLLGARSLAKAEDIIQQLKSQSNTVDSSALTPLVLDLTDDVSIAVAAKFDTNVFGVTVATTAFLPLLRSSTYHDRRIINVTSSLGLIGIAYSSTSEYKVKSFGLPVYRSNKTALNMLTAVDAVTLAEETDSRPRQGAPDIVRAMTEGNPKDLYSKVVDDENTLKKFGW
ncbi:hypothetical protein ASPWEDRAFT_185479 [Aspergillus wentii DTO 134E9]|uniref:Uncharacterized protein n=1 Tax=Aspergillus wentii DTO 134E9 TaxID=1073089 RepID=A0A1L9RDN6_ASPWE|nr:uncharacterized protein ASPWEDRAFT_185479 [Aspergillus wentii DTO 134E9]KAI9933309.1 hypothetical protein MW887_007782 [Aspergillus wentii]OJJ33040.1 hypothetical protein ASPWEDRAFT_185479 [Aspergillus wentii DTO 134E9]